MTAKMRSSVATEEARRSLGKRASAPRLDESSGSEWVKWNDDDDDEIGVGDDVDDLLGLEHSVGLRGMRGAGASLLSLTSLGSVASTANQEQQQQPSAAQQKRASTLAWETKSHVDVDTESDTRRSFRLPVSPRHPDANGRVKSKKVGLRAVSQLFHYRSGGSTKEAAVLCPPPPTSSQSEVNLSVRKSSASARRESMLRGFFAR